MPLAWVVTAIAAVSRIVFLSVIAAVCDAVMFAVAAIPAIIVVVSKVSSLTSSWCDAPSLSLLFLLLFVVALFIIS